MALLPHLPASAPHSEVAQIKKLGENLDTLTHESNAERRSEPKGAPSLCLCGLEQVTDPFESVDSQEGKT